MTEKAKGGRGQKAADPYQRLSVTIPPRLKTWVNAEAQRQGVTRSEVVVQVLTQAMRAAAGAAPAVSTSKPSTGPILGRRRKGKRR